ncbi:hypothetical protein B484DRAFT_394145, partial [Ochromonadaceae sp. CCMP2298]
QHSIGSRLTLLALTFPQLRLLWSRSPASTVQILRSLVAQHAQVDVHTAVAAGADGEGDGDGGGGGAEGKGKRGEADDARASAREMLLSLPGITVHNFRAVMHGVQDMAALSGLGEAALEVLVGPVSAKKLHAFFRQSS